MAKNKEINVFSVSFLDLLSGALAAIIILFIVIPKATVEQTEAAQTIERMNVTAEELESLIETARNSIPQDVYEQIQAQLQQMQELIEQLESQVENLQTQLQQSQSANEQLQQQLEQTTAQLESAQERIRELESQANNSRGISDMFFGLNASLGIVCTWSEDLDVDLWLKNTATNQWCYYQNTSTEFGNLAEDLTSRSRNEDFYELIFQRTLKPGNYEIWVHLYSKSGTANVSGYVTLFPGKRNEQKINYGPVTLSNSGSRPPAPHAGGGKKIGNLIVTQDRISLN